jgi:hypothetical protein
MLLFFVAFQFWVWLARDGIYLVGRSLFFGGVVEYKRVVCGDAFGAEEGTQLLLCKVSSNSHTWLAVISLPTFSGNMGDRPHSRDTSITHIIHLISTSQGDAKALTENLPVTKEHFMVGGQLINEIYHTCQLCQFPSVTRDTISNLTSLIISTHTWTPYKLCQWTFLYNTFLQIT